MMNGHPKNKDRLIVELSLSICYNLQATWKGTTDAVSHGGASEPYYLQWLSIMAV